MGGGFAGGVLKGGWERGIEIGCCRFRHLELPKSGRPEFAPPGLREALKSLTKKRGVRFHKMPAQQVRLGRQNTDFT
jgi:hypothetical protein